eukprot:m.114810 g.114810  ORF g.114810 m.114810 type:complete len:116 (+) comp9165_c0_seq9:2368-2715(+)
MHTRGLQLDTQHAISHQTGIHARLGQADVRLTEIGGALADGAAPPQVQAQGEHAGDAIYHPPTKSVYIKCVSGWLVCNKFTLPTKSPVDACVFANAVSMRKAKVRFASAGLVSSS